MQLAQDSHIEVLYAGGIAFDIGFEGASEKYYQQPAGRATLTRLVMDVATQQVCLFAHRFTCKYEGMHADAAAREHYDRVSSSSWALECCHTKTGQYIICKALLSCFAVLQQGHRRCCSCRA